MKSMRFYIIVLGIACGLFGCSAATIFVLFNNTGTPLRIYTGATWITIQPQQCDRFSSCVKDGSTLFILERSGQTLTYTISGISIPNAFFALERQHETLYLQMETNLSVYVITPKAMSPVSKFPQQPSGFPLPPKPLQPDEIKALVGR